jgi:broad specificity phosphatase PhoE
MRDLPELFVLRHGETEWNRARRWQGVLDSPLTEKGRAQALAMGDMLRSAGVTAASHLALSSPQGRAMATARLALDQLARNIQPEPLLREISVGEWAGLTADEIDTRWPGPEDETFLDRYARAPGGEPFDALWDRVGAVLERLTRPTVIVTHGITSRFLRTRAMGLTMADLDELPGGQGIVFRLCQGRHEMIGTSGLQPGP